MFLLMNKGLKSKVFGGFSSCAKYQVFNSKYYRDDVILLKKYTRPT